MTDFVTLKNIMYFLKFNLQQYYNINWAKLSKIYKKNI